MKPKLIALNLLLVSIVAATIWQGAARWNEAQALRRSTVNVPVKAVPPPPLAPVPPPEIPQPAKYLDVANRNLFSADRNPNVVVEPPAPVEVKKMPPLPIATGVMKLPSGIRAFMTAKQGEAVHAVKVDDMVGDFKIVALDDQNVTFGWEGKEIQKKIDDLIDRSNHQTAQVAGVQAPGPAVLNSPPPPPPQVTAQPSGHDSGLILTPTMKACKPGDNTPAGTVEDGYRKTYIPSPFGNACRWMKQ